MEIHPIAIDWTDATENLLTTGSGRFDGGIGVGVAPTARQRLNIVGDNATRITIRLDNVGAGDVALQLALGGTDKFTLGVDNTDGDKYKISRGGVLGTNDALSIDSSGNFVIGGTITGGTYNTLHIVPGTVAWSNYVFLSGDGNQVSTGLSIAIPYTAGNDFFYGFGGTEHHWFGQGSDLEITDDGNIITGGTGTFGTVAIDATIDHTLTDSSDDLVISNLNQDKDIIFSVNDGGTQKSFITIDSSKPALMLDPGTVVGPLGVIDIGGTYTTAGSTSLLYFHPIFSGSGGIFGSQFDIAMTATGNSNAVGVWATGNTNTSQSSGTQTLWGFRSEPDQSISAGDSIVYGYYYKPPLGTIVLTNNTKKRYGFYNDAVNAVTNVDAGATIEQYGIYLTNWGNITEVTGSITSFSYYSDGGDEVHAGNVRIGSTVAPTVALDVTGEAIINAKTKLTAIGGYAIMLTNTTGFNTVAGQTVKADPATDDAVILTAADDTECIGVFLDSGIADDAEAWVVVAGIADVAMGDDEAATHGNWVETNSSEAGYADATSASPAAAPQHFNEIGHCIESVTAGGGGTHILARCVLHFN